MSGIFEKIAKNRGYASPAEFSQLKEQVNNMQRTFENISTQQRQKAVMRRAFEAARIDRLTASWGVTNYSLDRDLYSQLPILRSRARQLCQNNDYAKKFLSMLGKNVVGPTGFNLRVRAMKPDGTVDKVDSAALEKHFAKWAKKGVCEVTGKYSFYDIQHLFIKSAGREGEVLIRKIRSKGINAYGFALQVLDIDRLDHQRNEELGNGNIIKMGVEMTAYGKPVAYHLFTKHPGDNVYYTVDSRGYERVPANEIYHCYLPDRPEQSRGLPWMHTAMMRLQNLGGYEEAAVIAARIGAGKMGFFTTPEGSGEALADSQDTTGNLYTEADPGSFGVLPEGYGFQSFNPDYPHAMYGDFVKACLRGIASGLDVAYNNYGNDLENVNFSSIRSGTLDERDGWMCLQQWMIESFMDDVYEEWARYALLNQAVTTQSGQTLPLSRIEKFLEHTWQGRRWAWVDPRADMDANVNAINNKLKSRADVIAEQGKDIDDVWLQLQAEEKSAQELGIKLPEPLTQNYGQNQPQNQNQNADNNQNSASA